MKCLRIRVNDLQFDIAMPQGSCGVIANLNYWGNEISIDGAADKCFRWYKGELEPGDHVTVEFTEIESPMQPEEVIFSKEEQIKETKRFYDSLRKELLEKGLINEDE